MSSSPMHPEDTPPGPIGDGVVPPGSLQITERRSWPTSVLVVAALIAGVAGALIGYLPDRGTPNSRPDAPSFPTGPSTSAPSRTTMTTSSVPVTFARTHPTRGNAARTVARAPL